MQLKKIKTVRCPCFFLYELAGVQPCKIIQSVNEIFDERTSHKSFPYYRTYIPEVCLWTIWSNCRWDWHLTSTFTLNLVEQINLIQCLLQPQKKDYLVDKGEFTTTFMKNSVWNFLWRWWPSNYTGLRLRVILSPFISRCWSENKPKEIWEENLVILSSLNILLRKRPQNLLL